MRIFGVVFFMRRVMPCGAGGVKRGGAPGGTVLGEFAGAGDYGTNRFSSLGWSAR